MRGILTIYEVKSDQIPKLVDLEAETVIGIGLGHVNVGRVLDKSRSYGIRWLEEWADPKASSQTYTR